MAERLHPAASRGMAACTTTPWTAPTLVPHLHAYPPAQRQALAAAHILHHAALAALHLAARPHFNACRLLRPGVVIRWRPRLSGWARLRHLREEK